MNSNQLIWLCLGIIQARVLLKILKINLLSSNNWKPHCFNCSMFCKNKNVAKKLSSKWNYAVSFSPIFTLWYWQWTSAENEVHSVEVFWHSRMLTLPESLLLKFYLKMASFEVWKCWITTTKSIYHIFVPMFHFESMKPFDFSWRVWFQF